MPTSDDSSPGSGRREDVEASGNGHRSVAAKRQDLLDADQTTADTDQSASDSDQTAADTNQALADSDPDSANRDQLASDQDQQATDRDIAASPKVESAASRAIHDASRAERAAATIARDETTLARSAGAVERAKAAAARDEAALQRDLNAERRDRAAEERDREAAELAALLDAQMSPHDRSLLHEAALEHIAAVNESAAVLRARAAAERSNAARDRERAARDREQAARDREAVEAELRFAHQDQLTGAYGRTMGRVAVQNEIDRARREGGSLVLAFIDVNGLKTINDESGHAAGDRTLQTVATALRSKLRSYEPLVRLGGDEFICTLFGVDRDTAAVRFREIHDAIDQELRPDAITVGLAALRPTDTLDELIARADAELIAARNG